MVLSVQQARIFPPLDAVIHRKFSATLRLEEEQRKMHHVFQIVDKGWRSRRFVEDKRRRRWRISDRVKDGIDPARRCGVERVSRPVTLERGAHSFHRLFHGFEGVRQLNEQQVGIGRSGNTVGLRRREENRHLP